MISSTQNRHQNTTFGATIYPAEIIKKLREAGRAPTTLSDIAKDIFKKTHCQGAGTIMASSEKMAFVEGEKGHNVVPSKQELTLLQNTRLVGYDLAMKGFTQLQKIHAEAKPATPKEIAAIRAKAKPQSRATQIIQTVTSWIKNIF